MKSLEKNLSWGLLCLVSLPYLFPDNQSSVHPEQQLAPNYLLDTQSIQNKCLCLFLFSFLLFLLREERGCVWSPGGERGTPALRRTTMCSALSPSPLWEWSSCAWYVAQGWAGTDHFLWYQARLVGRMWCCSLIFWRSCHWDKFCIFSISVNLNENNNFKHDCKTGSECGFFFLWHAKHASPVLVSHSSNPFIFKYLTIICQIQSNSIRIVAKFWNDTVLVGMILTNISYI